MRKNKITAKKTMQQATRKATEINTPLSQHDLALFINKSGLSDYLDLGLGNSYRTITKKGIKFPVKYGCGPETVWYSGQGLPIDFLEELFKNYRKTEKILQKYNVKHREGSIKYVSKDGNIPQAELSFPSINSPAQFNEILSIAKHFPKEKPDFKKIPKTATFTIADLFDGGFWPILKECVHPERLELRMTDYAFRQLGFPKENYIYCVAQREEDAFLFSTAKELPKDYFLKTCLDEWDGAPGWIKNCNWSRSPGGGKSYESWTTETLPGFRFAASLAEKCGANVMFPLETNYESKDSRKLEKKVREIAGRTKPGYESKMFNCTLDGKKKNCYLARLPEDGQFKNPFWQGDRKPK